MEAGLSKDFFLCCCWEEEVWHPSMRAMFGEVTREWFGGGQFDCRAEYEWV